MAIDINVEESIRSPLAPGRDFTCGMNSDSKEVCKPANSDITKVFTSLQQQIYRWGGEFAISIDGEFGPETLGAIKKLAEKLLKEEKIPANLIQIYRDTAYATGLGNICARAKTLASSLKVLADADKLPAYSGGKTSSGQPVAYEPPTPPASVKSNTIWWIVAAVGVVAAAAVGVVIYKRKKRQ